MIPNPITISIILPVFNGQRFLDETILSILNQSFKDFELLIWNDGSEDESASMIEKFAARDPRIRFFNQKENRGIAKVYRLLLSECRGSFIAQIGHDDVWKEHFLDSCLAQLQNQPSASACFSNVVIIDGNSNELPHDFVFRFDWLQKSQVDVAGRLLCGNFICAASSLARMDWVQELLRSMPELTHLHDLWLWQQLILRGPFVVCPERLAHYRIHDANLSLRGRRRLDEIELLICRDQMLRSPVLIPFLTQAGINQALPTFLAPLLQGHSLSNNFAGVLLTWLFSLPRDAQAEPMLQKLILGLSYRLGAIPVREAAELQQSFQDFPGLQPKKQTWVLAFTRKHEPLLRAPYLRVRFRFGPLVVFSFFVGPGAFPAIWLVFAHKYGLQSSLERIFQAYKNDIRDLVKASLKLMVR